MQEVLKAAVATHRFLVVTGKFLIIRQQKCFHLKEFRISLPQTQAAQD